MKKYLRILIALSIAVSSITSIQPASAVSIGALYNGTSGDVACTTGFFSILNNIVVRNTSNYSCTGTAIIPVGVTTVAEFALFDLEHLTTISIPNTVTVIEQFAFGYSMGITSLTIPDSVLTLGASAFENYHLISSYEYCGTALTSLTLANAGLSNKRKTCTPRITAPGSPISVVAIATGKRSATVSFEAPTSNGGSAVTSFTATSTPDGITQTLTQSAGGIFSFDGLLPSTTYTFAVRATNAIGTSSATYSDSTKTEALAVASLSELSFVDDGDGKSGKIIWAGMNIDSVLYKGPEQFYPGPFKFGAFTSGWDGRLRNLIPNTTYDISIVAFSADGVGGEKSLTFKTKPVLPGTQTVFDYATGKSITTPIPALTEDEKLAQLFQWIEENTYFTDEAAQMTGAILDFIGRKTSVSSTRFRLPIPSVLTVEAVSLTPSACSVVSATAEVDAGIVTALTTDKCTISYTVSGGSNARATWVRDFVFTYFELKCGAGTYKLKAGVVSDGNTCTGDVAIDATATSIAMGGLGLFNLEITSITLPNSITVITDYLFNGFFHLAKIELGNAVTSIGKQAFGYTPILSISLPNSLRTLGKGAFKGNDYLTSLVIPDGTKTVGPLLAAYSYSLTSVTIPSTVIDMHRDTFINSGVQLFNYCGSNESVLAAIAQRGTATCVLPALVQVTSSN